LSSVHQQVQLRRMKGAIVKRLMLYFIIVLMIVGLIVSLMMKLNPAFGANVTTEQEKAYTKYDHFVNGKFVNLTPTSVNMSFSQYLSMIKDYIQGGTDREPVGALPVAGFQGFTRFIWRQ
jgi:hypothetical protein